MAPANDNGSRRAVHGAGVDEPVVWCEAATLTNRRWLHADHQGSIIAHSSGSGGAALYRYSPYGEPGPEGWGGSRFRYTGQASLTNSASVNNPALYFYKARVYSPALGRFLQTDPVGYEESLNLYMYSRNDPLNRIDPSGEESFLISRPIAADITHSFVLVVDDKTGEVTRFSFGPSNSSLTNPGQLVNLTDTPTPTNIGDETATARFLANPNARGDGISGVRIDASDSDVRASGEAVTAVLGTRDNPGQIPYAAVPELGSRNSANSNSAALAVAEGAIRRNDTNAEQALPYGVRNPGHGESERIPDTCPGPGRGNC